MRSVPSGFFLNVPTVPVTVHFVRYRVQRGDTLPGIADRFDVTVEQLKRWNHIRGSHVSRGARLRIYAGATEIRRRRQSARGGEREDGYLDQNRIRREPRRRKAWNIA